MALASVQFTFYQADEGGVHILGGVRRFTLLVEQIHLIDKIELEGLLHKCQIQNKEQPIGPIA